MTYNHAADNIYYVNLRPSQLFHWSMVLPLTVFNMNEVRAYKTHKATTPGGGIGIVRPSPHISPATPRRNKVNVNVIMIPTYGYFSVGKLGESSVRGNFPPAEVGKNLVAGLVEKLDCDNDRPAVGVGITLCMGKPERDSYAPSQDSPVATVGEGNTDHPEDSDVGECDPGFPPEDI